MDRLTPPLVTGSLWPGVRYFSTTRIGGASQANYASWNLGAHVGDDPRHVQENRRRLRALLPAQPRWLHQVHGIDVADVDACRFDACRPDRMSASSASSVNAAKPAQAPQADAAITCQTHRVLAVLTADCLPVVIGDVQGRALGIAHAGWRGLAHGVLEQTLAHLRRRYPQAQDWRAWIGPAIGPRAFLVGRNVFDAFVATDPGAAACFQPAATAHKARSGNIARQTGACSDSPKWLADLPGLAAMRLRAAGVDQVQWCGHCTFSDPARYFSYRYQAVTGRIATCAWRCEP